MSARSTAPTLVDVAREAGVSLKTASRVLNNSPQLTPQTAKRVREAMAKLEYRPNELARGLKARRSVAIGMVVPNPADPFTAAAVQAVQKVARAEGYVVILASSGGDEALERAELESLARRQIDGLILAPAIGRNDYFRSVIGEQVPIVIFDQLTNDQSIDCVTVNNRDSARRATEHLLEHGKRSILVISTTPHIYTCSEKLAGYSEAMAAGELRERVLLLEQVCESTQATLAAILNGQDAPDAVFTLNWETSMLTLRALRGSQNRTRSDIAFISFDDFELADMLSPTLTVVRQPSAEMGRVSAELLFSRLKGGTNDCRRVVLPTEFLARGSCGCE